MKIPLLFSTVALQVVAFQLIWIRLNRRLPDLLIGNRDLPEEIDSKVAEFRRNAGRGRAALGVIYLLAGTLAAFVLPMDIGHRKLVLGIVSLLSSGTLVGGFVLDSVKIRKLSAALPEPSVRVAGLRPRSLSMAYPPVLEALPAAVVIATIAATFWVLHRGGAMSGLQAWIRPAVQIFYLLLTLGLAVFQLRTGSCLTWRARSFQSSPNEAVALSERIMRLEIRYLFYCRIAVVVLIGVMQARAIRAAMGLPPSVILQIAEWAILISILVQLILYLLRHPIRSSRNPVSVGGVHPGNGNAR